MASTTAIPEHFRRLRIGGNFVDLVGGLYGRWTGDRVLVGFRVEPRHVNPGGFCHGGMLATLADMLLPCAANYQEKLEGAFLPTISLQVDYLGMAKLGAWVEGEAQVLKKTRNLIFAQGMISADGEATMRVSGVYKRDPTPLRVAGPDPFGLFASD